MNREMQKALEADGEKLRALTGEDHGPHFISCEHPDRDVSYRETGDYDESKIARCAACGHEWHITASEPVSDVCMHTSDAREGFVNAFEEWMASGNYPEIADIALAKLPDGNYKSQLTFAAWQAWQAARRGANKSHDELLATLRKIDHTLLVHGHVDADAELHGVVRAAISKAESEPPNEFERAAGR